MKTSKDPRHQTRRDTVKALFAETFTHQPKLTDLAKQVLDQKEAIDTKISGAAPAWPTDKLNKIDLSILRLAIYELENTDTPFKVVIDEAIELAKEFGSENSPSFINGVLGTIYKSRAEDQEKNVTN